MTEQACATCRFWSPWLLDIGDCMEYAHKRREAMIVAEDPSQIPPLKAARMTEASDCCDQWAAPDAPRGELQ